MGFEATSVMCVGPVGSFGIANPGWTVRGLLPGVGEISAPVQIGSGVHPASCTVGIAFFSGVNRSGRDFNHPPHLVPSLNNEYRYTFTPCLGLSGLF